LIQDWEAALSYYPTQLLKQLTNSRGTRRMLSHPELLTVVENSFQDLLSNGDSISAKAHQINEGVELNNTPEGGDWEYIGEKLEVKRFKKTLPSNPSIIIIGGIGIIHTPPQYVYKTLTDLSRLKEWSSALEETRIINEPNKNITELYIGTRGKFPVAGRDFHLLVGKKHMRQPSQQDSRSNAADNRMYLVTVTSIESHTNVPEVYGKVRGVLSSSGFIIKPHIVNGFQQPCSLVSYVAQIDLKGWIPGFLTNLITNYSPLPMVKTFIPSSLILSHDNPVIPYEGDVDETEDASEEEKVPSLSPTKKQPRSEDDDARKTDLIIKKPARHSSPTSDTESFTSDTESFYDAQSEFDEEITSPVNDLSPQVQHSVQSQMDHLQSVVGQMNHSIATLEQTLNKVKAMITQEEQSKQRQKQLEESMTRLTNRITTMEQKIDSYYGKASPSSSPFSLIESVTNSVFAGLNNGFRVALQWITSDNARRLTKTTTMLFVLVVVWPVLSWKIYDFVRNWAQRALTENPNGLPSNKPVLSLLFGYVARKFT